MTAISWYKTGNDQAGTFALAANYATNRGGGNDLTGDYTRTGTTTTGSTATETNTYADGNASFTEVLWETSGFMVMGNALTGGYTRTESNGQHTSTLDATTTDATGNYVVTQSTGGNFTRMETGNSLTGAYTKNEQGNEVYSSQETGTGDENFTLTISGSISYSDDETGNRVTGNYTRTKTGTDSFQIDVNGTKTGGTYSQTVMGIESFTLTDTGNLGTGAYSRTIEGDGFYERTSTGDGATQPSDTGAIDYLFAQSADPHSGTFDASWTGTTRYDLLEDFDDISNTQPGRSPGHMNFYPFGQPFVDPFFVFPVAVPAGYWIAGLFVVSAGTTAAVVASTPTGQAAWRSLISDIQRLRENMFRVEPGREQHPDAIRARELQDAIDRLQARVREARAAGLNPELVEDLLRTIAQLQGQLNRLFAVDIPRGRGIYWGPAGPILLGNR